MWLDKGVTPALTPEQIREFNITCDEVFRDNQWREKQLQEVELRTQLARDAFEDSQINSLEEALWNSSTGAPE